MLSNFLPSIPEEANKLHGELSQLGDLERLISKAAAMRINPRELMQLKRSLTITENIKQSLKDFKSNYFEETISGLQDCKELQQKLSLLKRRCASCCCQRKSNG